MANFLDKIEEDFTERIFSGAIRDLFPAFEFTKRGNKWLSCFDITTGERSSSGKKQKTVIERGRERGLLFVINGTGGGYRRAFYNWLYKDYYRADSIIAGVQQLAKALGIEIESREDFKQLGKQIAEEERIGKELESIIKDSQKALYTEEGAETLKYLREKRGYSKERISFGGAYSFGAVTGTISQRLEKLINSLPAESRDKYRGVLYKAKESHKLLLPFVSRGKTIGAKFRDITGTVEGSSKYLNFYPIEGKTFANYPYGYSFTGTAADRNYIAVEGELDCLSGKAAGLKNIIAVSNCNFPEKLIERLQTDRVENISLLFDIEKTEEKQERLWKSINNSAAKLKAAGINCFIASLPVQSSGEKSDLDSFLTGGGSVEVVRDCIKKALSLAAFNAKILEHNYQKSEKTTIERTKLINGLIKCYSSEDIKAVERANIIAALSPEIGEELALAIEEEGREKRQKQLQQSIGEAIAVGSYAKAGKFLKQLQQPEAEEEEEPLERTLRLLEERPKTPADWIGKRYSTLPESIETGFIIDEGEGENIRKKSLAIPSAAVSLIGGYTSHGKSTFLQNLALDLLQKQTILTEEGEVAERAPIKGNLLYFSLEETGAATEQKFINTYLCEELSKNNKRSLLHYFRSIGERGLVEALKYFNRDYTPEGTAVIKLQGRILDFISSFLLTGRLSVLDSSEIGVKTAENIIAITKAKQAAGEEIGAVFVDFLQELEAEQESANSQRRIELRGSMNKLKDFAAEAKIPVVCAVQLNREANSPLTLESNKIAEAADIERYAALVVLLWNSQFPITKDKAGEFYLQAGSAKKSEAAIKQGEQQEEAPAFLNFDKSGWQLTGKAKQLQQRGFRAEEAGRLFIRVTKARGEAACSTAVLDFNGNLGKIESRNIASSEAAGTTAAPTSTEEQQVNFNSGSYIPAADLPFLRL